MTLTVKVLVSMVVGVPEISPEVLRAKPAGREPLVTDQV